MTEKRFTSVYNNQSDMIQYVDTQKEEPNRWSICNVSETLQKLNALHEENTILKQGITELAKNLQENVEFDRKQGITQYPTHIVFYMINQFKELIE